MIDITKETLENNDIEVVIDGVNTLWLNEKHIEEQLSHTIYQQSQTNMSKYTKN